MKIVLSLTFNAKPAHLKDGSGSHKCNGKVEQPEVLESCKSKAYRPKFPILGLPQ